MAETIEGGYHWQSDEHVSSWLENLGQLQPERAEAFRHLLALLPFSPDDELSFVDLGAGAGAVAALILDRFPRARAVLADFSQAMKRAGSRELQAFEGRYRYVDYDMNAAAWPGELAGPWQAMVSSQAIHHLPNPRKAALFVQVFEHLAPGGVFVNWDSSRDPQQVIDEYDHHARTLATVEQQLDFLRQAGFEEVACSYQAGGSALLSGRKPA